VLNLTDVLIAVSICGAPWRSCSCRTNRPGEQITYQRDEADLPDGFDVLEESDEEGDGKTMETL
jgi:hypothetical protein